MKHLFSLLTLIITLLAVFQCGNDIAGDSDETHTGVANVDYVLVIENGATSTKPGNDVTYTARLVDTTGTYKSTDVSWTTSDTAVATFSNSNILTSNDLGVATISAYTKVGEKEYNATVPLNVFVNDAWTVSPAAILGFKDESYTIETVEYSINNKSGLLFNYSSDNSVVASVDNNGKVTLKAVGNTNIKVTDSYDNVISVPVIATAMSTIALPVSRIQVTPSSKVMFRDNKLSLSAIAYDNSDIEVSTSFTWNSLDTTIAKVNAISGEVTAVEIGEVDILANSNGIFGKTSIIVYPDTIVVVEPYITSIAAGSSKQLTATAYDAKTQMPLESVTEFDWEIPVYATFSPMLSFMDFATVNNSGLVTIKNDAYMGMMTFIIISVKDSKTAFGVTPILVGFDFPF